MPSNVTITPAPSVRSSKDKKPFKLFHCSHHHNFSHSLQTWLLQRPLSLSQLGRLQLILNSLARAASKVPKFAHITPVLKSLHWLKLEQRTQYKVTSITYKVLQPEQPYYIHNLLNVQSNRTTHSSDVITLQRPSVRSRLKVTDRSFIHYAPELWNSVPKQLQQPSATSSLSTAIDSSPLLALSSHQFRRPFLILSLRTSDQLTTSLYVLPPLKDVLHPQFLQSTLATSPAPQIQHILLTLRAWRNLYWLTQAYLLTLNSKLFSLNNTFFLSLVCTNSCRFSGPLT